MTRRAAMATAASLLGGLAACTDAGVEAAATGSPSTRGPSSTTPAPSPSSTTPAPTPTPTIDLAADPAGIVARPQVPILCYHQIREWTGADTAVDRQYIIPPAAFTAQMDTLAAGGFSTVSPEQLLTYLTTGAELPERPVVLTYDDSVVDGATIALPAMAARGFTATFFLMTVALNKDRYLSDDQVRGLDAAGMTIGAHTWDHHRVDRYAGDDWRVQVEEPTRAIEGIVGHPVTTFAYPFGVFGTDAFDHLAATGITAAFQLSDQPMDPQRPLMTIRRRIADPRWSAQDLLDVVTTPA